MKTAIVTGSTGLVGTSVARYLSSRGIDILCLGRKRLSKCDIKKQFKYDLNYIQLSMESILSLERKIDLIQWSPGDDCVFFNFAWGGHKTLTDGSFNDQMKNAIQAAKAVQSAKKVGCIKFVNIGTFEETYAEQYLEGMNNSPYQSTQSNYAISKLASRDLCKMVAYLEKIDYVHTRLSVPLESDLSRGSYIASTLRKIVKGQPYESPKSNQLFDIVFTDDVAKAYHLIGVHGKNKADYYIGNSKPATLSSYFEYFGRIVENVEGEDVAIDSNATDPIRQIFDTENIQRDTGFVATTRFQDVLKNLDSI